MVAFVTKQILSFLALSCTVAHFPNFASANLTSELREAGVTSEHFMTPEVYAAYKKKNEDQRKARLLRERNARAEAQIAEAYAEQAKTNGYVHNGREMLILDKPLEDSDDSDAAQVLPMPRGELPNAAQRRAAAADARDGGSSSASGYGIDNAPKLADSIELHKMRKSSTGGQGQRSVDPTNTQFLRGSL